jgi:thermitase
MAHEYRVGRDAVRLALDHKLVAVRFHERLTPRQRQAAARGRHLGSWSDRVEVPYEKSTLVPLAEARGSGRTTREHALRHLRMNPGVVKAAPVYAISDGHAIATDRVAVGLRPGTRNAAARFRARGWKVLERSSSRLLVRLNPHEDAFAVCKELERQSGIAWAEPDFVAIYQHRHYRLVKGPRLVSGERRAGAGYATRLTRAEEALEEQGGDPRVVIAILDGGLHPRHPDLAPVVTATFDATSGKARWDSDPWDWHGTGCAALAAGANVGYGGVRGTGHGCTVMLIRLGRSSGENQPWVSRLSWQRRAIDHAWKHGGSVLNLSWGGAMPPSTMIVEALERARTRGRGGRGCVIVAAAGDVDGPVQFPANQRDVLAVAASNQFDGPKTARSRDGERLWSSPRGPEIDIAAPGVDLYTARARFRGSPIHTFGFSGTSGSAPLVAGAAALILSARPDLTERQVRRILMSSADKVGGVRYYRGRNNRMGHGRLNVLRAIALMRKRRRGRAR